MKLPRRAKVLDVVAKTAGVDASDLEPIIRFSTGIYDEADYLAQFEEDWEREEYGRFAKKAIAANVAAWQPPGPLLAALEVVIGVLADAKQAKRIWPDDQWEADADDLRRFRALVQQAVDAGASEVCLEVDEEGDL